jgi:hypothetical protein
MPLIIVSPRLTPAEAAAADTAVNPGTLLLSAWLPQVLQGFDEHLVHQFVCTLRDEVGVLTVEDLLTADHMRTQFSADFLYKAVGLKIGHVNRIEKALQIFLAAV